MTNLVETNPDYARALLLVAIFVVGMTGLQVYDGLQAEPVTSHASPAVNSTEIAARSTLR